MYNDNSKIVISDVDGTITKSDLLGQVLPRIGIDWSHEGICKLYTSIKANGSELVYLTSRPIGYADNTREYIKNIKQDADYVMPNGPVIMSPDRLMKSFKREVIDKQP